MQLNQKTDEDLMQKTASGNHAAFGVLVNRYLEFSLAYLGKRGCRFPEDIAQEAFIQVWRFAKRYREDRGGFKAWFFKILIHKLYDAVKKEKKVPVVQLDLELLKSDEDLQFDLEKKEEKKYMQKQIGKLSPKLKEVFLLKYIDGQKSKEIADYLGLSLKSVESRILRARKQIIGKRVENG